MIDMLFPGRCPVCDEIVMPKGKLICRECRPKLRYVSEPYCKKCGKPLALAEQEYCGDCSRRRHVYDAGLALFCYQGEARKSVERFKFKNKREYAEFYAEEMVKRLGRQIAGWEAEVLVPVPVHRSRLRERGYNQAAVLAAKLSKRTGIPMDGHLLIKKKRTLPQKTLEEKERIKNVRDAFQTGKNVVQYKKIIIVDDIYTTGSTADECAKVLKRCGAEKVYVLCLCTGKDY